jgi:hypothetical protein
LKAKETGIRVSFEESIRSAMPTAKDHEVWLMTVSGRLGKYLAIITKVNMDSRWKIVDVGTGQFWPISRYEDLREAMMLMKSGASSIRLYQAEFYNNRFLPLFKSLNDTKDVFERSDGVIITEAVVGFTARKLEEQIKKVYGETISRKALENKYLYPLVNLGILNTVRSQIDARTNIWALISQNCPYVYGSSCTVKSLDKSGADKFLVLLHVANTDVFILVVLVFPHFVSVIMPVSIRFSKNAWSFGPILSHSSIRRHLGPFSNK